MQFHTFYNFATRQHPDNPLRFQACVKVKGQEVPFLDDAKDSELGKAVEDPKHPKHVLRVHQLDILAKLALFLREMSDDDNIALASFVDEEKGWNPEALEQCLGAIFTDVAFDLDPS